jgi:hypothetical protein
MMKLPPTLLLLGWPHLPLLAFAAASTATPASQPPATAFAPAGAVANRRRHRAAADAVVGEESVMANAGTNTDMKTEHDPWYRRLLGFDPPEFWPTAPALVSAGAAIKAAVDWTIDTAREPRTHMRAWGRRQMARLREFVAPDDADFGCLRRCAQLFVRAAVQQIYSRHFFSSSHL